MAGVWIGGLLYDGMGARFEGWGFYDGALFFISAGVMFVSTIPLFFLPEDGARGVASGGTAVPSAEKADRTSDWVYPAFLFAMVFINFGRNSTAIIIPQYLSLDNGLALFMLAGSTALPVVYASSFLRGVADVLLVSTSYALASVLIPPESRARRFAWFNATFFLSWGMAGTLIAGPVVDFAISSGWSESLAYRASFASAGGFTLMGLALMFGVVAYRKRNNV